MKFLSYLLVFVIANSYLAAGQAETVPVFLYKTTDNAGSEIVFQVFKKYFTEHPDFHLVRKDNVKCIGIACHGTYINSGGIELIVSTWRGEAFAPSAPRGLFIESNFSSIGQDNRHLITGKVDLLASVKDIVNETYGEKGQFSEFIVKSFKQWESDSLDDLATVMVRVQKEMQAAAAGN